MNQFFLTQADYESRWNGWASAASEYCQRGYPVHYEGVDWQQACRDHGFYGAIDKVKAAYRVRQYKRRMAEGGEPESMGRFDGYPVF